MGTLLEGQITDGEENSSGGPRRPFFSSGRLSADDDDNCQNLATIKLIIFNLV